MHLLKAIELRDKFLSGEFTALEITEYFLNRIEKHDREVGSFLVVYRERSIAIAKKLDSKRATGKKLGKMAGIPIGIKDNIHVKGELTTCASKFLENYRAPFDSTAVRLLEEEDAIIIGKLNLDEFAMGSTTENSALKKTYNPWNLNCCPGGSSGGSAAAVAARLCPITLGTDTGGSIRQPAAFCGIVGFKPTYGRVSRYGLVAFGSSLDQIGPFSFAVEDSALTMEVIGQHCKFDSTSLNFPPEKFQSKLNCSIKGVKIGVPWKFLAGLSIEATALFKNALDVLVKLGAEIVEVDLSKLKYSIATYYILATAEASTNLARFDGVRYGIRSKEAETIDDVYENSKEEGFGVEVKRRILLGTYVLSSGYREAYYKKAQQIRTLIIEQHREAFDQCDLIATPTSPFPCYEIGSTTDPLQLYLGDIYTIGANLVGLPAISIPAGFTHDNKPFGLQLTGAQKQDLSVLQLANVFEKATDFHLAVPSKYK